MRSSERTALVPFLLRMNSGGPGTFSVLVTIFYVVP